MAGRDWVLGVDFGTSSTAAALAVSGRVELVEVEGRPRMPSLVFWREGTGGATGRLVLGEQAELLAVRAPWCLERTPKRRIGDRVLLLGDQEVRTVDAVGAILRRMAEEAISRRGGELPAEVRLTHPVRWGSTSLGVLRDAARVAGFENPVFVPEPVAAAVHFASNRLSTGEHVAVYDLGGGTFDTAVLRRTERSFEVVGAPGGNEDLGGEDFDERLYRHVGAQLPPDTWQQLRDGGDRSWAFANAQLLIEARKAKEILSTSPDYDLYLPSPIDQDIQLTAAELHDLIHDDLERSVTELERTITAANLKPADISAVYLAGGSSRIPLISRLIERRFGIPPDSLDDPKSAIALGAARLEPAADLSAAGSSAQSSAAQPAFLRMPEPSAHAAPAGAAPATEAAPGAAQAGAGPIAPVPPRAAQRGGEQSRSMRRYWPAVIALAAAVVAVILLTSGGGGGTTAAQVVGSPIQIGIQPQQITFSQGRIWVLFNNSKVDQIDPSSGTVVGSPITVGHDVNGFAVADNRIWASQVSSNTVTETDATSGRLIGRPIPVGPGPYNVVIGQGGVWVANLAGASVTRVDPASGKVVQTIRVGHRPIGLAIGDGSVWVTNDDDDTVSRIDANSGRVIGGPIPVGRGVLGIAVGQGGVWVVTQIGQAVVRLDPSTNKVVGNPIPVGDHPNAVAVGLGGVWVTNFYGDTVTRIDPSTGNVVGSPIAVGGKPIDDVIGAGYLWVVERRDGTVTRIRP